MYSNSKTNSKAFLPDEMLVKLLSSVHYEDRHAIDLTCKKFRDIAANNESKMKHIVYSCFNITLFHDDTTNRIGEVVLTDEFDQSKHLRIYPNSKVELFFKLKRVRLSEDGNILITFSSHSQILIDLKDLIENLHQPKKIYFRYQNGSSHYPHYNLLCNSWTEKLKTICLYSSEESSFRFFATDTSIKLHDQINLDFLTYSDEDNYDIAMWDTYLSNNKFSSIRHIAAKRLGSIKLRTFGGMLRMIDVDQLNERISSQGFIVTKTISKYHTNCIYSNGIERMESGHLLLEHVELEFLVNTY
uniref:F-box domain-containing protein n=1 Tax=Rhabditophanes sp. KR3021 TaxID=114890 RepID=A0AC35TGE6_9BILA